MEEEDEPIEEVPEPEVSLPAELAPIATRAAIEGIPVAAISRMLAHPFEVVVATLRYQLSIGNIVEVPRADWPPTGRLCDRVPTVTKRKTDADVDFACRKAFRLTALEAAFMTTLLKVERADKSTLHQVIEAQRFKRQQQPNEHEITDPKMVDVMICKLRKKLINVDKDLDGAIVTIWGGGYYIEPATKAALMASLFSNGVPDGQPEVPTAALSESEARERARYRAKPALTCI